MWHPYKVPTTGILGLHETNSMWIKRFRLVKSYSLDVHLLLEHLYSNDYSHCGRNLKLITELDIVRVHATIETNMSPVLDVLSFYTNL
jgi:hypothetical protein